MRKSNQIWDKTIKKKSIPNLDASKPQKWTATTAPKTAAIPIEVWEASKASAAEAATTQPAPISYQIINVGKNRARGATILVFRARPTPTPLAHINPAAILEKRGHVTAPPPRARTWGACWNRPLPPLKRVCVFASGCNNIMPGWLCVCSGMLVT